MTAYLSTGQGKVVRSPAFILPCPNCSADMGVYADTSMQGPPGITFRLVCSAACGADARHVIPVGPAAKGKAR